MTTLTRQELLSGTQGEQADLLQKFYGEIAGQSLLPLWTLPDALTSEPRTPVRAHLWRWQETRGRLLEAGNLISALEAERRVLILANPGLQGRPATTQTLSAGLQLVLPGEIAPTHRHTPSALRFIMEGESAYTTVDGERTYLHPGDFVTTPAWTWHDHGSDAEGPVIWLDGLDFPFILAMNQVFFEEYEQPTQPVTKPVNDSARRYGMGLKPAYEHFTGNYSPILNYPYTRTREVLTHLAGSGEGSPYDGVILEYTNPYTGGAVLLTMAAYAQLLRPGFQGQRHRHTSSTVYLVAEGAGWSVVGDQRIEWQKNDVFVVPTWAWHEHANASATTDAVLFSYTEAPILKALGLFREDG